jgi:hypothetical protein
MVPLFEAKDAASQKTAIIDTDVKTSLLSSTTRTLSVSWITASVNSSEILKKDGVTLFRWLVISAVTRAVS